MSDFGTDDIQRMLEQYLAICESDTNRRNAGYWSNAGDPWLIERWRGISARKTGARTISGSSMFLHQAVLQYEHFTGQDAPIERMRETCLRAVGK